MKKLLTTVLLCAVLGVASVFTSAAHAATLTVTNANDNGPGSLREAIYLASNGDLIAFDASLATIPIVLSSGELVIDKSLQIQGAGLGGIIIDGNGGNPVFVVRASTIAAISGMTIQNGIDQVAGPGGGVIVFGDLTLDHCVVRDNVDNRGGGIYSTGTLTIRSSSVDGNRSLEGGGIYSEGKLLIIDSTVSHNSAGANPGGGIVNLGSATIVNSSILQNFAKPGGGIVNHGSMVVEKSRISGNFGNHLGAGIVNWGNLLVTDSTISGNVGAGGLANLGNATVVNSMINDNYADESSAGGISNEGTLDLINITITENRDFGLVVFSGEVSIVSTTIANNSAFGSSSPDFQAVGLENYHSLGKVTIRNSMIAGNYWENEPRPSTDCYGPLTSLGHNLVGDGTGCEGLTGGINGDIVGADPMLLFEAHPADNGGPTETLALLADSPAIDKIPTDSCLDLSGGPLATDQRGVPRPQGAACDIGSFEFSAPRSTLFWLEQCREKNSAEYSPEELDHLFTAINEKSSAFTECAAASCAALEPDSPRSSWKDKAARELLGAWLNLASGRLTKGRPIELVGLTSATTVGVAVAEIEAVICNPAAAKQDLAHARQVAEALNESSD